eukprot:gnl/Carplike_NY0171/2670_a3587_334.p1 GENE.gnl/Carplike_NY0171/2670_a3587_334~~gnl/Carplike_NY0171/2670_a3587_334.p1  ORF type:complete len:999 (-),score=295.96 gnl/Carplike_NY0171/2670_a3587_334:73-2748(-)
MARPVTVVSRLKGRKEQRSTMPLRRGRRRMRRGVCVVKDRIIKKGDGNMGEVVIGSVGCGVPLVATKRRMVLKQKEEPLVLDTGIKMPQVPSLKLEHQPSRSRNRITSVAPGKHIHDLGGNVNSGLDAVSVFAGKIPTEFQQVTSENLDKGDLSSLVPSGTLVSIVLHGYGFMPIPQESSKAISESEQVMPLLSGSNKTCVVTLKDIENVTSLDTEISERAMRDSRQPTIKTPAQTGKIPLLPSKTPMSLIPHEFSSLSPKHIHNNPLCCYEEREGCCPVVLSPSLMSFGLLPTSSTCMGMVMLSNMSENSSFSFKWHRDQFLSTIFSSEEDQLEQGGCDVTVSPTTGEIAPGGVVCCRVKLRAGVDSMVVLQRLLCDLHEISTPSFVIDFPRSSRDGGQGSQGGERGSLSGLSPGYNGMDASLASSTHHEFIAPDDAGMLSGSVLNASRLSPTSALKGDGMISIPSQQPHEEVFAEKSTNLSKFLRSSGHRPSLDHTYTEKWTDTKKKEDRLKKKLKVRRRRDMLSRVERGISGLHEPGLDLSNQPDGSASVALAHRHAHPLRGGARLSAVIATTRSSRMRTVEQGLTYGFGEELEDDSVVKAEEVALNTMVSGERAPAAVRKRKEVIEQCQKEMDQMREREQALSTMNAVCLNPKEHPWNKFSSGADKTTSFQLHLLVAAHTHSTEDMWLFRDQPGALGHGCDAVRMLTRKQPASSSASAVDKSGEPAFGELLKRGVSASFIPHDLQDILTHTTVSHHPLPSHILLPASLTTSLQDPLVSRMQEGIYQSVINMKESEELTPFSHIQSDGISGRGGVLWTVNEETEDDRKRDTPLSRIEKLRQKQAKSDLIACDGLTQARIKHTIDNEEEEAARFLMADSIFRAISEVYC